MNCYAENSTGDTRTPQPGKTVFDNVRYRSEIVQRSGNFHSKQCQLCKGPSNVNKENNF